METETITSTSSNLSTASSPKRNNLRISQKSGKATTSTLDNLSIASHPQKDTPHISRKSEEVIASTSGNLSTAAPTKRNFLRISRKPKETNIALSSPSTAITLRYHESEINQNRDIVKIATRIIWAGFVVMCLGIICALCEKTTLAILTSISGLITEMISGVVFSFVSYSSKSKKEYFAQLSIVEECDKILALINTLDEDAKKQQVDKMVENYCQRRLNTTNP